MPIDPMIPLMGEPMNLARSVTGGAIAGNRLLQLAEDRKYAPMREQAAQMELESGKITLSKEKAIEQLRSAAIDASYVRRDLASGDLKTAVSRLEQRNTRLMAEGRDNQHTQQWLSSLASGDPAQIQAVGQEFAEIERAYQQYGGGSAPIDARTTKQRNLESAGIMPGTPEYKQAILGAESGGPSYGQPVAGIGPDGKPMYARFDKTGNMVPVEGFQPVPDSGSGGFSGESKLRGEFVKAAKPFVEQNAAFGRLQASANNPSPAGDMSLLFNYMKILDPGSTVREGEYASARNAGGVPEQVRGMFNRIVNGEQLSAGQRADFYDRSLKLFEEATRQHGSLRQEYSRLAQGNGFNPENVLINMQSADPTREVNLQGQRETKEVDGVRYVKIDGEWYEQ